MHGGVKSTLIELRARFWIVQGKEFLIKLLYKCVRAAQDEQLPLRPTKEGRPG